MTRKDRAENNETETAQMAMCIFTIFPRDWISTPGAGDERVRLAKSAWCVERRATDLQQRLIVVQGNHLKMQRVKASQRT